MHSFKFALNRLKFRPIQFNAKLSQELFEGWMDGMLLLTPAGDCLQANQSACQLIDQLSRHQHRLDQVYQEIAQVHQAVLKGDRLYPQQSVVVTSEIQVATQSVRLRGRLLRLETSPYSLVLISLEGPCRRNLTLELTDLQDYGFTPREQEVWQLRKANYTYKEIAAKLFITPHTVKKHLRNIRGKFRMEDQIAS